MARSPTATGRSPLRTALQLLLYLSLLGIIALGVAVAVAVASLPSYAALSKRSDLGQMIRVHGSNGAVLLSLGPSFGTWLPYEQIPAEMRSAMIAIEDKRFRSHIGVDPIGIGRSLKVRVQSGRWTPGRIDDHPAAGAQHLPDQQPQFRPQGEGSGAGAGDRA